MTSADPTPARGSRDLWRPLMWRMVAFAIVYLVAVAGFSIGVGVTERDLVGTGLAEKAYYALGLFVLGGLDIGTPVGGPLVGRVMLWSAYFIAPVITVSALVEAALRLIGPLGMRVRRPSDHVVIGGAGRLALLYVRKLRAQDPRRTIVVVDSSPTHPYLRELRDTHRALIVHGDIASDQMLGGLRLDRAHRVLLLTGDDFANLDAAAKALTIAPGLSGRIVVHVSDLGFMRQTSGSSVARHCDVFNGHEFAATYLVQEHLLKRFRATPHSDLVVLAGFGRFGQTVLHQLQQNALGSFSRVVIIDGHSVRSVKGFADDPGFADGFERDVLDGDLRDPEVWSRVRNIVRSHGHSPVVILGSGDDGTNLHAALRVRFHDPDAYLVVRSYRTSPFTTEVANEAGAHEVNLAALIGSGMPQAWF
jgi:voltage-gated potassium channel Kch